MNTKVRSDGVGRQKQTSAVVVLLLSAMLFFGLPMAPVGAEDQPPNEFVGVFDADFNVVTDSFTTEQQATIEDDGTAAGSQREITLWLRNLRRSCQDDLRVRITNPQGESSLHQPFTGCAEQRGLHKTTLELPAAGAGTWTFAYRALDGSSFRIPAVRIDSTGPAVALPNVPNPALPLGGPGPDPEPGGPDPEPGGPGNGSTECPSGPISPLMLNLNAVLGGAYDVDLGHMRDDLRTRGQLPTLDPYFSQLSVDPSVFTVAGDDAIIDWVLVELRHNPTGASTAPATWATQVPALMQRDGDIVALDGTSALRLGAVEGGTYTPVINHRSHLPIALEPFAHAADLTHEATAAAHLIAGDADGDNDINGADKSLWSPLNGSFNVYHETDFTMDASVDGNDKLVWSNNNGNSAFPPGTPGCTISPASTVDAAIDVQAWCQTLTLENCDGQSAQLQPPTSSGPFLGAIGSDVTADASGAAQWQLGIDGPLDGPTIGVAFSSHAADGELGVGFSLTGTSEITRCGKTDLYDGIDLPPDFGESIQSTNWCLDGLPLEHTGSTGAVHEYRTKVWSTRQLTLDTTGGESSSVFTVVDDSGYTHTYKPVMATRNGAQVVFSYVRTSVVDPNGNVRSYYWEMDGSSTATSYQLEQISWGGNVNTGDPHLYGARIFRSNRTEQSRFIDGIELINDEIVSSIVVGSLDPIVAGVDPLSVLNGHVGAQWTIAAGGQAMIDEHAGTHTAMKRYQFDYDSPTYDSRSYMTSVTLCESWASAANEWQQCLPATTFGWDGLKADADSAAYPDVREDELWGQAIEAGMAGSDIGGPFGVGSFNARRSFYQADDGTVRFRDRADGSSSVATPLATLNGATRHVLVAEDQNVGAGTEQRQVQINTPAPQTGLDVLRLVTDSDYFATVATSQCLDQYVPTGAFQNWSPDQLLPTGFPLTSCGINDHPDTANFADDEDEESLLCAKGKIAAGEPIRPCYEDNSDFVVNAVFSALYDAFRPTVTSIEATAHGFFGDFDGDGLEDRLHLQIHDPGASQIELSTGATAALPAIASPITASPSIGDFETMTEFSSHVGEVLRQAALTYAGITVADFNGDGLDDIYRPWGNGTAADRVYLTAMDAAGNLSWTLTAGPQTTLTSAANGNEIAVQRRLMDISRFRTINGNADACPDIYFITDNVDEVWLAPCGSGTAWQQRPGLNTTVPNYPPAFGSIISAAQIAIASLYFGDFNGDGCTDIYVAPQMHATASSAVGKIWHSNCAGGFTNSTDAPFTQVDIGLLDPDVQNGRGYSMYSPSIVQLSQDHLASDELPPLDSRILQATGRSRVRLADVNGDGLSDFYLMNTRAYADWGGGEPNPRDVVWLNQGDGGFVQMAGSYTATSQQLSLTNVGTNSPSNVRDAPFWNYRTKVQYDLDRHVLVAANSDPGAGLWMGSGLVWVYNGSFPGYVRGDCAAHFAYLETGQRCLNEFRWVARPEYYIPSTFDRPELVSVTPGSGVTTNISYDWYRSTNDDSTQNDPRATARVVSSLSKDIQATSGANLRTVATSTDYDYAGLRIDPDRGSLGFAEVVSTEVAPVGNGRTRTTVTYDQSDYLVGAPQVSTTEVSVGCDAAGASCSWEKVRESTSRMQAVQLNSILAHASRSDYAVRIEPWSDCTASTGTWGVETLWTLGTATPASRSCVIDGPRDRFGNLAWQRAEFGDGYTEEVTMTYDDLWHGRFGLPNAIETVITDPGGDVQCTVEWNTWDTTTHQNTVKTVPLVDDSCAPTGTQRYVHTSFAANGLVDTVRTGGTSAEERVERYNYGTGRLRHWVTSIDNLRVHNDLGEAAGTNWHSEIFEPHRDDYEFATAQVVLEDDGVVLSGDRETARTTFDDAGRKLKVESGTDESSVEFFYNDQPSAAEINMLGGYTRNWTVPSTGGASYEVLDRYGRIVRTARSSGAGIVVNDAWFDDRGRQVEASAPYVVSSPEEVDRSRLSTVDAFDPLDRPIQTTDFAGTVTTSTFDNPGYSGIGVSPYYPNMSSDWVRAERKTVDGVLSLTHIDARGRVLATTNALNETIWFKLAADDAHLEVRDAAGNTVTSTYDNWGRMTSVQDPDLGTVTFELNVFGDVTKQVDELGTETVEQFDPLGRRLSRVATASNGDVATESWVYDVDANANNAWNRLAVHNADNERIEYHYDASGRLVWTEIDADANGDQSSLDTYVDYDANGRPFQTRQVHPDGSFSSSSVFDSITGQVVEVRDPLDSVLWAARGWDAAGNLALFQNGNGTVTHKAHDLDIGQVNRVETIGADGSSLQDLTYVWNKRGNLDELTNAAAGLKEAFTYDDLDRLRTSQVKGGSLVNYGFDAIGNLTTKSDYSATDYVYAGTGNAGPHAVTSAGGNSFAYDSSGLLITQTDSGGNTTRSFQYTPDRKVASMVIDAPATDANRISLVYGANSRRIRQATFDGNNELLDWSWYLSDGVRHTSSGTKVTVMSPVGPIAEVDGPTWTWLHTDHLGSTELLTDGAGNLMQRLSYSAFGEPRDPATGVLAGTGTAEIDALVEAGFTGHARLDDFGLINMRARMYDPGLGRFLQPDTVVQAAGDNQTWARYSYTRGNPLKYTDPSGHVFDLAAIIAYAIGQTALNFGAAAAGVPAPQLNYASFSQMFGSTTSAAAPTAPPSFAELSGGETGEWLTVDIDSYLPSFTIMPQPMKRAGVSANIWPGPLPALQAMRVVMFGSAAYQITGQDRHYYGYPDAVSIEITYSKLAGAGFAVTPLAGVLVLAGPDEGKFFPYSSGGLGYGWEGATWGDVSVVGTAYYYTGAVENFSTMDDFAGQGKSIGIGIGIVPGLGASVTLATADLEDGEVLFGFGFGLGTSLGKVVPWVPSSWSFSDLSTETLMWGETHYYQWWQPGDFDHLRLPRPEWARK